MLSQIYFRTCKLIKIKQNLKFSSSVTLQMLNPPHVASGFHTEQGGFNRQGRNASLCPLHLLQATFSARLPLLPHMVLDGQILSISSRNIY